MFFFFKKKRTIRNGRTCSYSLEVASIFFSEFFFFCIFPAGISRSISIFFCFKGKMASFIFMWPFLTYFFFKIFKIICLQHLDFF